VREGFTGPLFIQGDHVQVNAKKYAADPAAELKALKALIEEELHAGFYNIDVDTSTLVDLSKPNLRRAAAHQLRARRRADAIHSRPRAGRCDVSVGAEIGEVGGKNSDVHELDAFMEGYNRTLKAAGHIRGHFQISVQTGTSHGGVVFADGRLRKCRSISTR